jgi:hypothetical protein
LTLVLNLLHVVILGLALAWSTFGSLLEKLYPAIPPSAIAYVQKHKIDVEDFKLLWNM